jgi:hypothetical protein
MEQREWKIPGNSVPLRVDLNPTGKFGFLKKL